MKNLLLYCGLVDAKSSASKKDLPVSKAHSKFFQSLQALACMATSGGPVAIFLALRVLEAFGAS